MIELGEGNDGGFLKDIVGAGAISEDGGGNAPECWPGDIELGGKRCGGETLGMGVLSVGCRSRAIGHVSLICQEVLRVLRRKAIWSLLEADSGGLTGRILYSFTQARRFDFRWQWDEAGVSLQGNRRGRPSRSLG